MTGLWEIILPYATTNLVTNPSLELATTGYTAVGSSIARSTTYQRWGAYSLAVTPTSATADGVYYGTVSLTNGTTYTFSVYFKGAVGVPYRMYFGSTAAAVLGTPTTFTGDGKWHRYEVTYTETSSTTRRLYVVKNSSNDTNIFYIDGVMCEALSAATTYVDGDQEGCLWNGGKHASTSTRSVEYRPGGKILNLDAYNCYINQMAGAGMPPITNVAIEYGQSDGALYQRSKVNPRVLALNSVLQGTSLSNLHAVRDTLIDTLKPDVAITDQPLTLRYRGANTIRSIKAVYEDGAGFGELEGFNERLGLRFVAHDPYWYEDGETAAALGVQSSFTANYAAQRTPAGVWGAISSGFDSNIFCIAYDVNNDLYYFGGDFTTAGGVAANRIVKYDPNTGTFTAMGTGANNSVIAIAVDVNGDVYAGGAFTSMGGVANTSRIAKWNGSAWSALGTGALNNTVQALAFDTSRNLFAGGLFTQMGGVANTAYIAKWSGSAWSALGTGMNVDVLALKIGPDGYMYVGGSFTTGNGVTLNGIGYWNGTTFVALSTGTSGSSLTVRCVEFGSDGSLYVGGDFTAAGGVSCAHMAKWNGSAWSPLGTGMNSDVYVLLFASNGALYAGGSFTTAGGYTLPDSFAQWNGSSWLPVDLNISGTAQVLALAQENDGTLTIGWQNTAGTATTAAVTSVTNNGKANAYPRLMITGPSSGTSLLYQLVNFTTKSYIFFSDGLTLNAGEVMVLDFKPGAKSFKSNFQSNLLNKVFPGSNTSSFRLKPGVNSLSFYASAASVTANLVWTERHWSFDGGAQ